MKNTNYSVKKHQSYWVLFFALLFCSSVQAKVTNYVGAYLDAGEWTLMPSGSKYGPSFGGVGSVGALYELQSGDKASDTRFLFDVGLGVHGGWTQFNTNMATIMSIDSVNDLEGDLFNYVYEITGRKDSYTNIAAQVPLLIGVQSGRFYMLAGLKANINVLTKYTTTATLNTYGNYYQFTEEPNFKPFRDMPELQFFSNLPMKYNARTKWNLDVDFSLELGGRLGELPEGTGFEVPRRDVEYRLAAFMDIGLLDLHVADKKAPAVAPTTYNAKAAYNPDGTNYSMVKDVVMNDIFSTDGFAKAVRTMTVGLKFTILFQLHTPERCVMCSDSYRSLVPAHTSRRGVQYEE